jgi:two-component system response regulator HydG
MNWKRWDTASVQGTETQNVQNAPRPRMLIVDDDEGIRRSLSRIMRSKGFDVELAGDGESAVELACRFRPQVLILDIRLPGMDGVATFSAIRQELPSVAAVFMTAYAASDRAQAAHDQGGISVFRKPLDISAVVELAQNASSSAPVLIVDDDHHVLSSLSRALRTAAITAETANSLESALHSIRQRPDRVVVADVFLEDGFGYELLGEMTRRSQEYALVLVTGNQEWLRDQPGLDSSNGKLACMAKPLDVASLVGHLQQLQRPEASQ